MRSSVSPKATSCTCRTTPEQNFSRRCWTAASTCALNSFVILPARPHSRDCPIFQASNSSVIIKKYCRRSTLNHQLPKEPQTMRSVHSRTIGQPSKRKTVKSEMKSSKEKTSVVREYSNSVKGERTKSLTRRP